jgi:hypothetical protein
MNQRAQRTERVARRLIKSMARRHIYEVKSAETNGAAYDRMLMLEAAILEESRREWRETLSLWTSDFDRLALLPILAKVTPAVYRECRETGDELGPVASHALKNFFDTFDPQGLLT